MKRIAIVLSLLGLALVPAAQAHNGWYQTATNAQDNLYHKFPGINSVRCTPDRKSGSFVKSNNRWWEHFVCGGYTTRGNFFMLRYHQLSANGHTITNLYGVSIYELRG
jgi:hypothetical protein